MTIQNATHEAAATFRDAHRRGAASADVDRRRDPGRLRGAANGGALRHTLYAIELPGIGLTDRARYHHTTFRSTAVAYLADILDALEIGPGPFGIQSMGPARPPRPRGRRVAREYRGVAEDVPGLYFCGPLFQCAVACSVLPGVGHDAAYVAQHIHHPASARAAIAP